MKKTNKPEIGKLTVIRKPRKRAQDDRQSVGIIEEAIGAVNGAIAAGKRLHAVIRKIRGK